jgi:hypothetical protein
MQVPFGIAISLIFVSLTFGDDHLDYLDHHYGSGDRQHETYYTTTKNDEFDYEHSAHYYGEDPK